MEKELRQAAIDAMRDNTDMEMLLRQVIEMDERQQQLTDAALHMKQTAKNQAAEQIARMREEYESRGEAKLAVVELEVRQEAEANLVYEKVNRIEKTKQLEAAFAQNREALVQELVARTLNLEI